jgi:hypothetical protein
MLTLVVVLLLGLLVPDGVTYPFSPWERVILDDIRGVIIPAGDPDHPSDPESAWTPTIDDIIATEEAIARSQGTLVHRRQYWGIVNHGQREVVVNGMCHVGRTDWTRVRIQVEDGGECFFHARYNVEMDELTGFSFNGDA